MPAIPAEQSRWIRTLIAASTRRRRVTILVWLLALAVASLGLARLRIDTTITSALNRTDAAWRTYLRSLEKHGGDDSTHGNLFTPFKYPTSA